MYAQPMKKKCRNHFISFAFEINATVIWNKICFPWPEIQYAHLSIYQMNKKFVQSPEYIPDK